MAKHGAVVTLNRLTGIRALAAVFVVGLHYGDSFGNLLPAIRSLRVIYTAGGMGVDLFFILSGFILSHNYLSRFSQLSGTSYRKFLVARFARLYPVHLFTLLLLSVVVVAAQLSGKAMNAAHYSLARWTENVLLIQAWPGLESTLSWNYPAWSISAEWSAYVIFPLLAAFIYKTRRPVLFCGLSLVAYMIPACLGWIPEGVPSNWSLFKLTSEFFAGCFLYRIYMSGASCPLTPAYAGIVSVAATISCNYFHVHDTWAAPAYLLLLWSLAEHPTGVLGGPVGVYLGQASYSLYMTHGVVQIILNRICPTEQFVHAPVTLRLFILFVYFCAIAGAALITYHAVETPARLWLLRRDTAKRRPTVVMEQQPVSDMAT